MQTPQITSELFPKLPVNPADPVEREVRAKLEQEVEDALREMTGQGLIEQDADGGFVAGWRSERPIRDERLVVGHRGWPSR